MKIENIGKVNYIECRRSTMKVTTPFVVHPEQKLSLRIGMWITWLSFQYRFIGSN